MSKTLGNVIHPAELVRALRRRSAAAVSDQGSHLRRRRRLLVVAPAGALQRRPGQQPGQPGQPDRRDGGEIPRRARGAGRSARPSGGRRGEGARGLPRRRWMRFALEGGAAAAFRIIDAANEYIAETEPWALARDEKQRRAPEPGAVRRGGSAPRRRDPAAADHPEVGRGDPAAGRRDRRPPIACASTRPPGANDGERTIQKGDTLWPRIESDAP